MKFFLLISVMLYTQFSLAGWNEVECYGDKGDKSFVLEVEMGFAGQYLKKATLLIKDKNQNPIKEMGYFVSTYFNPNFNQITYRAPQLRADVDIWPDRLPRWGWSYRAILDIRTNEESYLVNLKCEFPNAQ